MRGTRWTVVLALGAVAACLATTAPAQATTTPQLLKRYQPVTVLDPLEPFTPTDVGGFVGDSVLQAQTSQGVWTTVDEHPTAGTLPRQPTAACTAQGLNPCYRLNQSACTPSGGVEADACYRDAWLAGDPRNVVYARVKKAPHKLVLQYWYFYYDDLYSYDYPQDDLFWQAHEGDWEVVNVVLDRDSQRPLEVAYSQHCTGTTRDWSQVGKIGTHPVDHVAIGSHANLLDGGSQAVATSCIPAQALQILQANGLPAPVDRAGDGTSYGPGSIGSVTPTALRRMGRERTPWIGFAGTWGEYEVFHAPPPIGTVAPGTTSPVSPALTRLWQRPLTVISGWPRG